MPEWAPRLAQLVEELQLEACHPGFRLFLAASGEAPSLSAALLQQGTTIWWEAPQVSSLAEMPLGPDALGLWSAPAIGSEHPTTVRIF